MSDKSTESQALVISDPSEVTINPIDVIYIVKREEGCQPRSYCVTIGLKGTAPLVLKFCREEPATLVMEILRKGMREGHVPHEVCEVWRV